MESPLKYEKNVNYKLYQLIENNKLSQAEKIIFEIFDHKLKFNEKEYRGFVSLVLKYYIMIQDDIKIDNIFQDNKDSLMKRDILTYCNYYYYSNYEKALMSFIYLNQNYLIDASNLSYLIENKMFKFLSFLDGKYIKLSKNYDLPELRDTSLVEKYRFDKDITHAILSKLNIYQKNFFDFLDTVRKFDGKKIIIDGGNILFAYSGKINKKGYELLLKLIKYFWTINIIPILIIHNRHLKSKKTNQIIKIISEIQKCNKNFIFETPFNENDDLYILYSSLFLQSNILSNDNYKDHIYNFKNNKNRLEDNLYQVYIESLVCNYTLTDKFCNIRKLELIDKSLCIQVNQNNILIPTVNDNFLIFKNKPVSTQ